jgi:hypothetical protein
LDARLATSLHRPSERLSPVPSAVIEARSFVVPALLAAAALVPTEAAIAERALPELRPHVARAPILRRPSILFHPPASVRATSSALSLSNEGAKLCYERSLAKMGHVEGYVSVRFAVGRLGGPIAVMFGSGDVPDEDLRRCIVRLHLDLRFVPTLENRVFFAKHTLYFRND